MSEEQEKLEQLRKDVRVGLDQLDAGEGIPLEQARKETEERRQAKK